MKPCVQKCDDRKNVPTERSREAFCVMLACLLAAGAALADETSPESIDVPFEGTPPVVAEAMLRLAEVTENDIVCDLGCGDGRIVIMAAKQFGAESFGVDIDPQRLKEANENAAYEGVADRVKFTLQDIFETDFSRATVVTLYLLNEVNAQLCPHLFRQLKPGSRVVSHAFHMGEWEYDKLVRHPRARSKTIYLWVIPAPLGGTWEWTTSTTKGDIKSRMVVRQEFQVASGSLTLPDMPESKCRMGDVGLIGRRVTFTALATLDGQEVRIEYQGEEDGDAIRGTQEWLDGPYKGKYDWLATRGNSDVTGRWRIEADFEGQNVGGVLQLSRGPKGVPAATYTFDQDAQEVPVPNLYLWGSSVRFEMARQGSVPLVFKGLFEGDTVTGVLLAQGRNTQQHWQGKRELAAKEEPK